MKQAIESAFPQAKNCLESNNSEAFGVQEIENRSHIVENPDDGILKVSNPLKKMAYLLAVDQCVFSDDDRTRRCDCAVFDDTLLYFVEIKACKPKNRADHRGDAIEQLTATIEFFRKSIDFQPEQLQAVICFKSRNTYPTALAKQRDAQIKFKQDTGVKLSEANKIELK